MVGDPPYLHCVYVDVVVVAVYDVAAVADAVVIVGGNFVV